MQYHELTSWNKIGGDHLAAAGATTGVDTQGYEQLLYVIVAGTGVNPLDAELEDSADNSAWASLTPVQTITQIVAPGVYLVKVKTNTSQPVALRRYVRLNVTTLTGGSCAVISLAKNLSGHNDAILAANAAALVMDVNNVSV